jgi:hypothetical protein
MGIVAVRTSFPDGFEGHAFGISGGEIQPAATSSPTSLAALAMSSATASGCDT